MSQFNIYPSFNWPGTIWLYSDPHFGDEELYTYRGTSAELADYEQVKRINSKVGKHDTIVFLGDIGDVNLIKKIHGYKVLICGNHDRGASHYRRVIKDFQLPLADNEATFIKSCNPDDVHQIEILGHQVLEVDTHLFDEVYTGCLLINEKIMLSHEPVEFQYAFNIHGHDHSGLDFKKYVLQDVDSDIPSKQMSLTYLDAVKRHKLARLNICAEWIGYYPVALSQIVKSGVLSVVPDIHRDTIDLAAARKENRKES